MSTSTHEQNNITFASFEKLLSFQFFGKELIFWLNAKDAAKLKQCSKNLNQLIKMEDVFIENEPLIFRRLVFQKKFNLLEKCIPFRINKQQIVPLSISRLLCQGFARIGNLKAIQTLKKENSFQLDSTMNSAIEFGQTEIVRFLMDSSNLKMVSLVWTSRAYLFGEKEILLIFLEHMAKVEFVENEDWKKLYESILNESKKSIIDKVHLDYLYSLCSVGRFPVDFFQYLEENDSKTIPLIPNGTHPSAIFNIISNQIQEFPTQIPPKLINQLEIAFQTMEKKDDEGYQEKYFSLYINLSKARWSIFVNDFETFKSQVTTFEMVIVMTGSHPFVTILEYVVERTIQSNLPLDFFNHCLNLMKERSNNPQPYPNGVEKSFNTIVLKTIQFKRSDLFRELISIPFDQKGMYWQLSLEATFRMIGIRGDAQMLKDLIQKRSLYEIDHLLTVGFVCTLENHNYEVLECILEAFPKNRRKLMDQAKLSWVAEKLVFSGDIDLMKRLSKEFDFERAWSGMLRSAVTFNDELAVELILNNFMPKDQKDLIFEKLKEALSKVAQNPKITLLLNSIRKFS